MVKDSQSYRYKHGKALYTKFGISDGDSYFATWRSLRSSMKRSFIIFHFHTTCCSPDHCFLKLMPYLLTFISVYTNTYSEKANTNIFTEEVLGYAQIFNSNTKTESIKIKGFAYATTYL